MDPDTGAATVPGLFAAGGGRRLTAPTGSGARCRISWCSGAWPVSARHSSRARPRRCHASLTRASTPRPRRCWPMSAPAATIPTTSTATCSAAWTSRSASSACVGALELALSSLRDLARRAAGARAVGGRVFNGVAPRATCETCCGRRRHRPLGADAAGESRRALTSTYPHSRPPVRPGELRGGAGGTASCCARVRPTPLPAMPAELKALFETAKEEKVG